MIMLVEEQTLEEIMICGAESRPDLRTENGRRNIFSQDFFATVSRRQWLQSTGNQFCCVHARYCTAIEPRSTAVRSHIDTHVQAGSHINDENLEAEFDKETQRASAQAQKLQDVERGMMKQIFPSANEKRELQ